MGIDGEHRRVVSAARQIAIVGAGPAGLFAAERLAAAGHRVTIYERMPAPARKFLLAGRGGLNLTHSEALEAFLNRYGDSGGAQRVRDAVRAFPPEAMIAWAQGLGVETFVGSSGRVFPKAMKASSLLRAWLRRLESLGVELRTRHLWTGFAPPLPNDPRPVLSFLDADGRQTQVRADGAILALGGASWPRLGSDGAWVHPLAGAGVEITTLAPSNCGVTLAWSAPFKKRFAGKPLKRISVSIGEATRRGEAVITEAGLEGGAVYALGPQIRNALRDAGSARLHINLRPDAPASQLAEKLAGPRGGQSTSTFLRKSLRLDPQAIALLREACAPSDPTALASFIKAVPIPVTGLGSLARAISTAGGVAPTAIDDNWMLAAIPGVFVAGEMVDWDAPTGGYLLQGVFATGRAAADGVIAWLRARSKP